jgi:hypothetical protein
MCAQGFSIASKAKTWNCIMTDAISRSCTSLLREHTWVKPTAQPLWDSGRVEWEAAAQRRADREKARTAAAASQEVRVRLQEEIEEAKKQRRRTTREREKARQFDRQREEIHPPHVLSALAAMQEPAPSNLRLPEAKPDPEEEYPVHVLPIRSLVPEDT